MLVQNIIAVASMAGFTMAQTLNIPTRVGSVIALPTPSFISGSVDLGNREFDRGHSCNAGPEPQPGGGSAVFVLENGATLSNVIIGARQLEGIYCRGACTLRNVWFRDVCENAITAVGTGNILIEGGGAQEAPDRILQHNGRGTVTLKDFTVVNAGKLYRSCGNCSNNGGPRNIIIENLKASGVSELIGINSNFGDTATISGSCGSTIKKVCQEYKGVQKGSESPKVSTTANCGGQSSLSPC